MFESIKRIIHRELKLFFQLKKTERLWHIPVLASLCVGIPLLVGYYFDHLEYGILGCLGGLVILYMPPTSFRHRFSTTIFCGLGFILSFTIGIVCSFNGIFSSIMIGIFAFIINWTTNIFKLGPPGNFFFIMIAVMASCMPFDLQIIPIKVGIITLGVLFACTLAFIYSLYITKKHKTNLHEITTRRRNGTLITESFILGIFIMLTLLVGHLFKFSNPYWIPISALAIMQGITVTHVWQRSFYRMLGTYIGIGLTWIFLQYNLSPLTVCILILVLQFVIEMLVVRHYAFACVFITPLTIFLADIGSLFTVDTNQLISIRLTDIIIGSVIGGIGGWILHNQQLKAKADRQLRMAKVAILRKH